MKPVDAEENPGLAKLPTSIRNKMGYMKKGGLMKKPRRFEAGGEIEDDRTSKDQDIGDDVRARARKFLETGKKDEEAPKKTAPKAAAPKAAPVKTESKAAPVKAEVKSESAESDYAKKMKEAKNQAPLSRVTSNLGSPYPVDKPKEAVKNESSKLSYAEKMEAGRNQTSLGKSIRSFFSGKPYGAEKYEREETPKPDATKKMATGGSASSRADGCAIRGKTRA